MTDSKNSPQSQSFWRRLSRQRGWGKPDILHCKSSVFTTIIPILTFSTIFTSIICALFIVYGIDLTLPGSLVGTVSVVVGLLLAFRTNHAYDRYYEGRKLFASLCTLARNTARIIWVDVEEKTRRDHDDKETYIRLLLAFVIATKHHLRLEFGTNHKDFDGLLPKGYQRTKFEGNAGQENTDLGSGSTEDPNHPDNATTANDPETDPDVTIHSSEATESTHLLQKPQQTVSYLKDTIRSFVGNRRDSGEVDVDWGTADPQMSLPMEIVFHLGAYFDQVGREKRLELSYRLYVALDQLIDILGNLERISNTPIPAAYRIHLKQAVTLYVWVLPFTLVDLLGWFTIPIIFIISFILFGVEAIGSEIEDPFGYDKNDLPLDEYCRDLEAEIKYLCRYLPTGQSEFHH